MAEKPVRAILYGFGHVGRPAADYLVEKGVEIAAVYMRNPEGRDLSAPALAGAAICRPDVPFDRFDADILVMMNGSRIDYIYEPAMQAAGFGLDVLTIAEDAFEPFFPDETLLRAKELDEAFRKAGKTLLSCGVQDVLWFGKPMALLSAVQRIDRVIGRCVLDLGSINAEAGGFNEKIGLSAEEFTEAADIGKGHGRGVFEVALRPLIRALGLDVQEIARGIDPVMASEDMPYSGCSRPILKGTTCGSVERVTFLLSDGVIAEGQFIMKYLRPGEPAFNEWEVRGLPSMTVRMDSFKGEEVTPAAIANRIADVLAAPPGFLSVDQLPPARYHHRIRRA